MVFISPANALDNQTDNTKEKEMANKKCTGTWSSTLKPKSTTLKSDDEDGVITISESAGKLTGKHSDSDDFPVQCDGATISFTRVAKSKNKLIVYSGNFTSDTDISGTYTRTDSVRNASAESQAALSGDSGDWEATKPPTLLNAE